MLGLLCGCAEEPRPVSTAAPGYEGAAEVYDEGDVILPVVGVNPRDLSDTFRAERSGQRSHLAIDIFAPRGTPVVALTDGALESVGQNPLGGNALWLRSRSGRYAFYYAHLDAFAPGLRTGQRVSQGDTLGTVGTTGNARGTPPHLHLQLVLRARGEERTLNPYPLLRYAEIGR